MSWSRSDFIGLVWVYLTATCPEVNINGQILCYQIICSLSRDQCRKNVHHVNKHLLTTAFTPGDLTRSLLLYVYTCTRCGKLVNIYTKLNTCDILKTMNGSKRLK